MFLRSEQKTEEGGRDRMEVILKIDGVTRYFGGFCALDDVSAEVKRGEIFGLIGPNGAGKTTLLNAISGIIPPSSGKVLFKGQDVTGRRPHAICRLGISRVFQTPRPFLSMTVLENVAVGAIFGGRDRRGKCLSPVEGADSVLHFLGLHDKRSHPVGGMNLQEKKMIEVARALSTQPDILLIDEVMSGLNPIEVEDSIRLIKRLRDELEVTILWVEHVMKAIMGSAERVMVLDHGRVIATGSPAQVAQDQGVIGAYLGGAWAG
jgi:branched-chain amino acid transport system ATP-binding protein